MSQVITVTHRNRTSPVAGRTRRARLSVSGSTSVAVAAGALLLAGGLVRATAGDEAQGPDAAKCEEKCPAAAKVATAIQGWKAAASAPAPTAVPEAEQARLRTELASVASECPVGSRVGETLGFVKAVLASTTKLERAATQKCPIDASGDQAACQVKAARAHLVGALDELAGHAVSACPCPCPAAREGAADTAGLAEKALELLASWDRAPAEIARMPAAKKAQLAARAGEIAHRVPSMALLPPTLEALQVGFGAVDTLNGELCDWVKAHPDLCKDLPGEVRTAMTRQMALLHATAQILDRARSATKACGAEGCAPKPATAATAATPETAAIK